MCVLNRTWTKGWPPNLLMDFTRGVCCPLESRIRHLAMSENVKFLLCCFSVRAWNLDTQSNVAIYRGHNYPIWGIESSPMGLYFATASKDNTARLWTAERTFPLRIFVGHLMDVDVNKCFLSFFPLIIRGWIKKNRIQWGLVPVTSGFTCWYSTKPSYLALMLEVSSLPSVAIPVLQKLFANVGECQQWLSKHHAAPVVTSNPLKSIAGFCLSLMEPDQ